MLWPCWVAFSGRTRTGLGRQNLRQTSLGPRFPSAPPPHEHQQGLLTQCCDGAGMLSDALALPQGAPSCSPGILLSSFNQELGIIPLPISLVKHPPFGASRKKI